MANRKKHNSTKLVTDADRALLDQLGVDATPQKKANLTAREQRIIAGFEEIERFVEEHGRTPHHGEENDIFERLYAVRLDQMCSSSECRELLEPRDSGGLLSSSSDKKKVLSEDISNKELLAALGVESDPDDDITTLKHVKSTKEKQTSEEVAQRTPCKDFHIYKPLFEQVQQDLETGKRQTRVYRGYKDIKQGDFYILEGQKIYVDEMGEIYMNHEQKRQECRLRVIFDNGTESALLLRSLQRALNKNEANRLITEPTLGPLFSDEEDEGDIASGTIYILRSKSKNPFIAENRSVIHKIGVTGGDVKKRITNAKKDPTYLLADVEIVETFKLSNINRKRLESLLHRFFASARLDLAFQDRFGQEVEPREWFLVPLPIIEEAINKLMDGSIADYRYDPESAQIVQANAET